MNFEIHTPESAPNDSKEALSKIVEKYGFVPNLAGVISESPFALQGLLALMTAYDTGEATLTPLEKQIVLLATSVENRCEYCTAAHSMVASMAGLEKSEVRKIQDGMPLADARQQSLRDFTENVVRYRGRIGKSQTEEFLSAGFSKGSVMEVILGVALKTLTNYINHFADTSPNEQFSEFAPSWTEAA
jgi:uncharacterized peroxidase-related enzyme